MKRLYFALLALAMSACALRAPVHYSVNIDLDRDKERVRVTSVTELERSWGDEAIRKRLDPLREALAAERDDWSVRFQQINPESERVTVERQHGELVRVEHSGVMERDQLARFFGDLPMTVTIVKGDGWTELAIYPGSSPRASRLQRDVVDHVLDTWSHDLADYFNRMSRLYEWLDAHPQMAEHVFTLLFEDEDKVHAVDEEENALLVGARNAMGQVTARLQRKEGESVPVDELFDLVYNPFPADITIRTPRAIVGSEHFEKRADDVVFIRHAGLLDAARTLEGKWLSPDPLAILLRSEEEKFEMPPAAELAAMKRKWSQRVAASELQTALVNAVKPAESYRVRWVE
jgi:hypothetical protein